MEELRAEDGQAIEASTPQNEWASNDPYSVRWRELETELRSKVYEVSDEELEQFKIVLLAAFDDTEADDLDVLEREVLDDPIGLRAYYQARRRIEEVETRLADEGLVAVAEE